ncbi:putative bifunctional diguanylate cyclase/phosphodiesterase [Thiomicrorhabdus aquaedulcis]|uniref:putative bifunctional diguanylate cyclase/phosphodiesterase n=1 Tax=Thiomicrorhabdus aquaedulcis TaxID=2211106 RepID=UPI000FD7E24F|nr:GGDEF domain-containing phosphodiesterase [Thiomicrorhabdus aquaedulcis]
MVLHSIEACLNGQGAYRQEYRMHHAHGGIIWVQDRGDVVERDAAGQPLRMMGSLLDVTAQKQTEVDLRIAAAAFETQEGMCITDLNQRILRVNNAFTQVTGFSFQEVLGRNPSILHSGRHSDAFYQAMWATINRTGGWQGEVWNRRKNGEVYPEWLTITAVKNTQNEVTHYVASMSDITQRKDAEEAIKNLAYYDPLTHLPNRRLLQDRLQQAVSKMARDPRLGALMFIDLDNFKTLNDTLGHDVGDQLLQQVAGRLSSCVREVDTVARLGGDEFVVMLCELDTAHSVAAFYAENIAEKVLKALNQPYRLMGHNYLSTPSIGVTMFSDHKMSVDELLKRADLAMYQAKAMGRNAIRFYDPKMQAEVSYKANLELDLRQAIQSEQFALYYQKQVDQHGVMQGVEALIRWTHPVKGAISPAEFIPLAEETGLIIEIGDWVIRTACQQLALWAMHPATMALTLSVNVSARQFLQANFVSSTLLNLINSGAPGKQLKLELTESMLLTKIDLVVEKMSELKHHGIGFSLDDFGTGYSSLSYLKKLPLDQLKIDQSFVRDIIEDVNDAAIAQAVIALAESLGLAVIAEGVETEAQKLALLKMGCRYYQGYFFGRPVPIDQLDIGIKH